MLQVGGEPRKPQVPHCEERPGAAHSKKDQALSCISVDGIRAVQWQLVRTLSAFTLTTKSTEG